ESQGIHFSGDGGGRSRRQGVDAAAVVDEAGAAQRSTNAAERDGQRIGGAAVGVCDRHGRERMDQRFRGGGLSGHRSGDGRRQRRIGVDHRGRGVDGGGGGGAAGVAQRQGCRRAGARAAGGRRESQGIHFSGDGGGRSRRQGVDAAAVVDEAGAAQRSTNAAERDGQRIGGAAVGVCDRHGRERMDQRFRGGGLSGHRSGDGRRQRRIGVDHRGRGVDGGGGGGAAGVAQRQGCRRAGARAAGGRRESQGIHFSGDGGGRSRRQGVDAAAVVDEAGAAQRSTNAAERDGQRIGGAAVGVCDRHGRERMDQRFRGGGLSGHRSGDGRRQRRIGVDHRGRGVDGGGGGGAAGVAQRQGCRRAGARAAGGRRESQGIHFSGDGGGRSRRQGVDAAAVVDEAGAAQRSTNAAERDGQRIGGAAVGVCDRHGRERMDQRFRGGGLSGHRSGDGRRQRRIGVDHRGRGVDGGGGGGAAGVAQRQGCRRAGARAAGGRRESQGIHFSGDGGGRSRRQGVDAAAVVDEAGAAQRSTNAAERDGQRIGGAAVGVCDRHGRERMDQRFRGGGLSGHRSGDGRRQRRIGVDHRGRGVDGGGGGGAAGVAQRQGCRRAGARAAGGRRESQGIHFSGDGGGRSRRQGVDAAAVVDEAGAAQRSTNAAERDGQRIGGAAVGVCDRHGRERMDQRFRGGGLSGHRSGDGR